MLVVVVDCLRADRLGAHGYPLPTTPAIDGLAAEGVDFTSAFAHATWTKPSVATLFTSLYPSRHGLQETGFPDPWPALDPSADERPANPGEAPVGGPRGGAPASGAGADVLPESIVLSSRLVTVAERFRDAGYATGAVFDQVHLLAQYGFDQGFEHYDGARHRDGFELSGALLGWLDDLAGRPFFAYLHLLDLHWPYDRRLPAHEGDFGSVLMRSEPPRSAAEADTWAATAGAADLAALEARYDQEVAFADAALGELLAGLAARGLLDDTVVLVTADHGEGFLEHGRLQHEYAPYDELLHVPLVLRAPPRLGLPRGVVVDAPVGLIDVMPTLLDLAGLAPEPTAQGRTLVPLLEAAAATGGSDAGAAELLFAETEVALAVRSPTAKMIVFANGVREVYDLRTDAGERSSLPAPCEGPCAELDRRLRGYLRDVVLPARGRRPETVPLDPEVLEELRSLGYLGGGGG